MNNKRSYKGGIFTILALVTALVFAFFAEGKKTPEPNTEKQETKKIVEVPKETQLAPYPEETDAEAEEQTASSEAPQEEEKAAEAPQEEAKAAEATQEEAKETPKEEEKEAVNEAPRETEKSELYCTLSVRCDTIFEDTSRVSSDTLEILPKNGVIFAPKKVEFQEGESVFDVLSREMRNSGIHLEFVDTPIYGTVYIEGIGNLYEFDAGELSGWMYKVNGVFPNYGCSKYYLKKGDKVEFVYTCDLGKDVGGEYTGGQGGKNE